VIKSALPKNCYSALPYFLVIAQFHFRTLSWTYPTARGINKKLCREIDSLISIAVHKDCDSALYNFGVIAFASFLCHLTRQHIGITLVSGGGVSGGGGRISLSGALLCHH